MKYHSEPELQIRLRTTTNYLLLVLIKHFENLLKRDPTPGWSCNIKQNSWRALDLDKSRTYIRHVLDIIDFKNYLTRLFFLKYAHEHTSSVSWVREPNFEIRHTCTSKQ